MRFDLRGGGVEGEGGAVDEDGFVLDGGVGGEAVGGDLVFEDFEVR